MIAAINRINPDSIENVEDVRAWARDHELHERHDIEQLEGAVTHLKDLAKEHGLGIAKNTKMLLIATAFFGAVLTIVTLLAGVIQIVRSC